MPRIKKLLIANRGEIARRITRTARQMGISVVCVYARPDAQAPFVREADEAVALEGATSAETYLDIPKLLDAARRTGAGAVHPGYGFLAENPGFARAVLDAGLIWVGPRPEAIAAMGDKLAAKEIMRKAGIPTLRAVQVPDGRASLARQRARSLGYPLLVKAAAGGGGRGMRIVTGDDALDDAIAGATREAAAAFADGTVFLERYLPRARHIEVQVLGDRYGNIVHCFERECSIQRRHQKIIEEAPSPAVDEALRQRLGAAAVSAARAIGYDSAGTVEFLLDEEGQFHFLEMNTRLQVEHPVTEEITGLDLVREQIRIAEGDAISFQQHDLQIEGHAVEARLYAEDPATGFLPSAGRIVAWVPEPAFPVRVESGVESGTLVPMEFDPLLAKLIAHAPTREEAALRLASALERLRVHGVTTNRDLLVAILRHEAFLAGDTTTDFIERYALARQRDVPAGELARAALAAALLAQQARRAEARVLATIPSGWRNNPSAMQEVRYRHREAEIAVRYLRDRGGSFSYQAGEQSGIAKVLDWNRERIDLEIDGLRQAFTVSSEGPRVWVQTAAGEVELSEVPRFPERSREVVLGGHVAPMPGKVLAVNAEPGQHVSAGQVLVVLEAMKMEHLISCTEEGVVKEVRVTPGAQVEAGQVLVVVEPLEG